MLLPMGQAHDCGHRARNDRSRSDLEQKWSEFSGGGEKFAVRRRRPSPLPIATTSSNAKWPSKAEVNRRSAFESFFYRENLQPRHRSPLPKSCTLPTASA